MIDETQELDKAISALKVLSSEAREYLLDRFYSRAEISAELKRRYQKRKTPPLPRTGAGDEGETGL